MNNLSLRITPFFFYFLTLFVLPVSASDLTIPNQFTSGARAVAAEVNVNFDAVATSVNDNQAQLIAIVARLDVLEAENAQLLTRVNELETTNQNLQTDIDSLNAQQIIGLNDYLSISTDSQDNPIAIFSGINLHVNNGSDTTASINGLGNLVIGFNEITTDLTERCSTGTHASQEDCESASGTWSHTFKFGSHNLIIGEGHNYSNYGGLVAGQENDITGQFATVAGGSDNKATGFRSHVSGGRGNEANGISSSVAGGKDNKSTGSTSHVSGGSRNEAIGRASVVSGGAERESLTTDSWTAGSLSEVF